MISYPAHKSLQQHWQEKAICHGKSPICNQPSHLRLGFWEADMEVCVCPWIHALAPAFENNTTVV